MWKKCTGILFHLAVFSRNCCLNLLEDSTEMKDSISGSHTAFFFLLQGFVLFDHSSNFLFGVWMLVVRAAEGSRWSFSGLYLIQPGLYADCRSLGSSHHLLATFVYMLCCLVLIYSLLLFFTYVSISDMKMIVSHELYSLKVTICKISFTRNDVKLELVIPSN